MPTASPHSRRSSDKASGSWTQSMATDDSMTIAGATKNSFCRPMRSVSQPPKKPPANTPSRAMAATMPCQKPLSCSEADMGMVATPMMLRIYPTITQPSPVRRVSS
ncbi:hypothetical protein D9M71_618260 [compost metagenome]